MISFSIHLELAPGAPVSTPSTFSRTSVILATLKKKLVMRTLSLVLRALQANTKRGRVVKVVLLVGFHRVLLLLTFPFVDPVAQGNTKEWRDPQSVMNAKKEHSRISRVLSCARSVFPELT
jgi:hypothetical protein